MNSLNEVRLFLTDDEVRAIRDFLSNVNETWESDAEARDLLTAAFEKPEASR